MEDVYRTTDKGNRHDAEGREILNPTPVQPPLGYKKSLSLAEQIRQQVLSLRAHEDMEPESLEEADDFDIEDEEIPVSRWENDMVPSVKEMKRRGEELQRMVARAPEPDKPPAPPREEIPEPEPKAPVPNKRSQLRSGFWPSSE